MKGSTIEGKLGSLEKLGCIYEGENSLSFLAMYCCSAIQEKKFQLWIKEKKIS